MERPKRFNFFRPNTLRLTHLVIFGVIYFFTFSFQSYYLVPPPGSIDSWVNLGYGQAFPDTAYPGHYYKESRIISIIWVAFVQTFPSNLYSYVVMLLISSTGYVIFRIVRGLNAGNSVGIVVAIVVCLNPTLWGDQAGGGDYYNTFGNFLIVVTVYRLIVPLFRQGQRAFFRRNYFVECGFWLSVLTLEIPSGIIVSAIILIILAIQYFRTLRLNDSNSVKYLMLLRSSAQICLGIAALAIFESLLLLILSQSPIRLLAGPKFLFDSIFNSSTQSSWWTAIPFGNLKSVPSLFLYFTLLIIIVLYTLIVLLVKKEREQVSDLQINLALVLSIFLCLLLALQILGKTIALTTSYFTTPILILLLTLLPALISPRNSWIFIVLIILILNIQFERELLFIQLITLIVFLGQKFYKDWELMNSWLFMLLLILTLFASNARFNSSQFSQRYISEVCNSERLNFRTDLIRASEELDTFGSRGSILMGADDFIFTQTTNSECYSFDKVPLSYYLISLSALGYPSAASLGTFKSPTETIGNQFFYESFSQITNRLNPIKGCYFNFVERETGQAIVITRTILNYEYLCSNDKQ